jgi:hypothetical protein
MLIYTSARVEVLRDIGCAVSLRVDALVDDDIATCDLARMKLLAGLRHEQHLRDLLLL